MTETTVDRRVVIAEGFQDGDEPRLVLSVCASCESRWFPPRPVCASCASEDVREELSGTEGVAYASTVVRVAPASFPTPYVLSYVDIDGVRLLAHTDGDEALTPDTRVRLTSGPIGRDGDTELWSYRVTAHLSPLKNGSR